MKLPLPPLQLKKILTAENLITAERADFEVKPPNKQLVQMLQRKMWKGRQFVLYLCYICYN